MSALLGWNCGRRKYIIATMESQYGQCGEEEPLVKWIRDLIKASGPITFARFMEHALYHPQFGYYTTGPSIGPRGDFTTSPEASPAFGKLMARHVADIDELLGHPSPFDLVECGPGQGTLAAGLLSTLAEKHPALYSRLRVWLIETSPTLVARQQKRLLPAHESIVSWQKSVGELPQGVGGALLANEFVDAFPVHVLENSRGRIQEHYVYVERDGSLHMACGPPSRPELLQFLERYDITLEPGQQVEVNLAAEEWIAQVGRLFSRGVATIIDYGDTSPGRYSEARKEGTLLGYYGGAVTKEVLARPGKQDLTALVDFTALQDASTSAGFEVLGLTRQAHFLVGLGLGTVETAGSPGGDLLSEIKYRRGLQALVSMEGLGRFHVLLLSRGVSVSAAQEALSGLQYAHLAQLG